MRGAAAAALLLALALPACSPGADRGSERASGAEARLPLVRVEVLSGGRSHVFAAELASTPEQQARGLMFRERLGAGEGMLFPFSPPRPASFWMKNTLIPLDMVFIRPDGTIGRIAANTVPQSLEPVRFGEPVAAVLEISGGRAAALGIREGDRVRWPGGPA